MKGQYITLENMFFFAIGVAMVLAVYMAFSSISDSTNSATLQNQLLKEAENIRSGIARIYLAGNSTGSVISLSLDIPKELSGCGYKITADKNNLYLTCIDGSADSKALSLYGIETKIKNDAVYGSSGKINIYYAGGSILIS